MGASWPGTWRLCPRGSWKSTGRFRPSTPRRTGTTLVLLQPQPTKPGSLTDFKYLVEPEGIVSTGLPAVRDTLARIGVDLDPWQQDIAKRILAKDCTGEYAADMVALS